MYFNALFTLSLHCCISFLGRKYTAIILYTSNMLYPSNTPAIFSISGNILYISNIDVCMSVCVHVHVET